MVEDFMCNLKVYRVAQGLTQEQLAEKLNIGVRSLGKIETGNSFPSMTTLEKIIETFQIPTVELFNCEHLQPVQDLKKLTFEMINSNPDKIKDIYKIVKALTS